MVLPFNIGTTYVICTLRNNLYHISETLVLNVMLWNLVPNFPISIFLNQNFKSQEFGTNFSNQQVWTQFSESVNSKHTVCYFPEYSKIMQS